MASVALTGTCLDGLEETNYVAGGKTTILTLTDDTYVAAGATFNATRAAIIAGCDSGGAEAAGWDAELKADTAVTAVVRTSNTVCTITWPANANYNITKSETVTVTVPAAALTGNAALVAAPTFSLAPCVTSILGFGNRAW
jgi:hypothetical protein